MSATISASKAGEHTAGALLPPPNFPAGGLSDTCRHPLPFAAPTCALEPPAREAAETPAAIQPPGRGAPLSLYRSTGAPVAPVPRGGAAAPLPGRAADASARLGKLILEELVPEPEHLAPDLAALVAVALFTAAIVVWLDALAGVPGI